MAKQMTQPSIPRIPTKATGKSIADFRASHDKNYYIPLRITEALKKLGNGWEYEGQFIKLAGVSQTDIGLFREQFSAHVIETRGHNPKRVWCGTTKLADELRSMVD